MSAAAAGNAPAPQGAGTGGGAGGSDWKTTVLRGMVMYFGVQLVTRGVKHYMAPPSSEAIVQSPDVATSSASLSAAAVTPGSTHPQVLPRSQGAGSPLLSLPSDTVSAPLWGMQEPLDFYVFLSSSTAPSHQDLAAQLSPLVPGSGPLPALDDIVPVKAIPSAAVKSEEASAPEIRAVPGLEYPMIKWQGITLGGEAMKKGLSADLVLQTPESVIHNNGSIWADIVVVPHGQDIARTRFVGRSRKMLTRLLPPRRFQEARRLIEGKRKGSEEAETEHEDEAASAQATADRRPVPFWHRNLTLAVPEQLPGSGIPATQLPPPLLQWVHPVYEADGALYYPAASNIANYPVVFPNTFWDLREDTNPINSTTPTLPLHISLYTTSWFKFQLLAAMSDSFDKQAGMGASELDLIKNTLLTTSPYYLIFTLIVTLLHSLFEFLAFSSDVTHWKKRENLIGVSVGTILTKIITSTIILLYLIDSSEETSWMILGSQAVGIAVEAWKLTKALTVNVTRSAPGSLIPYRLDIKDKHVLSPEELETQQFDRLAFKIVAAFVVPLLGAYTIYSAVYQEHRGWWNFTISTLVSFVYSFGFVSLIPQLIVNYKMKSVAGVAPKTLVYKILTTFIDDIFAFAIKMPLLHRLATLRDDVVFVVWLVQAFILYPTDNKRVNEFGQVVDPTKRKELEQQEKAEEQGEGEPKQEETKKNK